MLWKLPSGDSRSYDPEPIAQHRTRISTLILLLGTATAILLSALGVPRETIRDEYLLTNEYRGGEIEAFYILEGSYIDGTLEQVVGPIYDEVNEIYGTDYEPLSKE